MGSNSLKNPPALPDDARVLMITPIDHRHVVTGATRHFVGGELLTGVRALAIAQYDEADSFYLFYCSGDWLVLTDTLHGSVAAAQAQAEFEFQGTLQTWQPAPVL